MHNAQEKPSYHAPDDEAWVVLSQAERLPVDVASRVLHEAEEVLEDTSLVATVDVLLAETELLELPVKLLADRAVDHLQSFKLVGCVVVHVVVAVDTLPWVLGG